MTPLQMQYVLTLAEQKNFSKAAKKLCITQPSLSQYIQGIERQIGTQLFDRSSTPISLTAAGVAYCEAALSIQAIQDELKNKLSDYENLDGGSLKIGASTFRSSYMLARSISEFCSAHQKIRVSILDDNHDQLCEMLTGGSVDVVIGTGKFSTELYDIETLSSERLYVAISKNIRISDEIRESCLTDEDINKASLKAISCKPVSLSSLTDLPFILTQNGEFGTDQLEPMLNEVGAEIKPSLTVRTISAAFAFVAYGFGATIVPDSLIRFGNIASHPDYYPLDPSIFTTPVYLVTRRRAYMSKAALEYCLTLKRLIASGTWILR